MATEASSTGAGSGSASSSSPIIVFVGSTSKQSSFYRRPEALNTRRSGFTSLADVWWSAVTRTHGELDASRVLVISNALHYKYFERWAMGKRLPVSSVFNTGITTGRCECGAMDVVQALTMFANHHKDALSGRPVIVVPLDVAPSCAAAVRATEVEKTLALLVGTDTRSECVLMVNDGVAPATTVPVTVTSDGLYGGKATPPASSSSSPPSTASSPPPPPPPPPPSSTTFATPLLALSPTAVASFVGHTDRFDPPEPVQALLDHVADAGTAPVRCSTAPTPLLDADVSSDKPLSPTHDSSATLASPPPPGVPDGAVHTTAFARMGLMGNPSDGFLGKTMAITISNFWAEAWIWETPTLALMPHELYDSMGFDNVGQLSSVALRDGYSGGHRLMMAAVHRFFQHVSSQGVTLPDRNFTLTYHTNVPRQVGLAGSSAIIVSLLRALFTFYGLNDRMDDLGLSLPLLAQFVLHIETQELGIQAGLQDRVAQTHEGCVYMDFSKHWFDSRGYGEYTHVDADLLPPLFLAYAPEPSDSGKIHTPVKQRWLDGDEEVVSGMQHLGDLTTQARDLLKAGSDDVAHDLGKLMTENFATRISLYGEGLGDTNKRLVAIAVETGSAAKFPGSGGAAVGVCDLTGMVATGSLPASTKDLDPKAQLEAMHHVIRTAYQAEGFVFVPVVPYQPEGLTFA